VEASTPVTYWWWPKSKITPPDLSVVTGSTRQLQATPKTSSGITVPNRSVSWSSDDPGIASVSTSGLVTAVATGSTQVNATVDGVRAGIPVEVTPKPVVTVSVVPSQSALLVGETVDLIATPRDDNSQPLTGRTVSFASDNPLIATVSGDGHVRRGGARSHGDSRYHRGQGRHGQHRRERPTGHAARFPERTSHRSCRTPLPAIRIEVQNDQGGAVSEGNMPVTIALGGNPTGAVLGGTRTVNTVNGVAIFNDLTVNHVGIGYTLVATSGTLAPAESAPFAIVAGAAAALTITTQPSATATSGAPLAQQPVIQVRDVGGNPVAKSGIEVTAVLNGAGASLGGVRTATTNAEGVATFTSLALTGPAGTYTLLFAAPSLTSVTSTGITIKSGPPATIAIVQQPAATAQAGVALSPQPSWRSATLKATRSRNRTSPSARRSRVAGEPWAEPSPCSPTRAVTRRSRIFRSAAPRVCARSASLRRHWGRRFPRVSRSAPAGQRARDHNASAVADL
jgi:hypothetical protein